MAKYADALKAKALVIADTATVREASEQTGIPEGTIKRWRFENRTERGEPNRTNRTPKNLEPMLDEAMQQATAEAGDYIAQRLKGLADRFYTLAEKALGKVDVAISDGDEVPTGKSPETHDRDGAAWLRSLVGVLAQSIDKAQLLSGKPTVRPEVVERYEYDVTQRIISERPELLDAIFAPAEQSGVADRGGSGARSRLGQSCRSDISPTGSC